ncbi:GatB/YqeY domain-containing protein [Notoacmeibacter sp. MSK16QG-6]|uniref:GatB/YqeY domain-containing protein n=1 Tax=Notoacmeibacter sp. MSK16QG-6 TaxID=2957982 RepID=UPI00209EE8C5|nr:GatB/YqeY domain-containing protein [Notoacmeibacter sp. MSK16QG-6]MCP1199826.1 GatB/YqeY domain-containing protein [Notoacmeibacter sp. MSK16QG-6]
MRDQISAALNEAVQSDKRSRACMLRLIQTAINDRDVANRADGKDPISEAEIGDMLMKMIHQREASAAEYEARGRLSEAEEEREEIQIVRDLLPRQLDESDTRRACAQVIEEVDAGGLRDVGRCMNALKEKFPGQMDFGQASGIVKGMLR